MGISFQRSLPSLSPLGPGTEDQPHLGYYPIMRDGSPPLYCMIMTLGLMPTFKELEWADDMTDSLRMYTLVFQPNLNVLTMLQIDFTLWNTGRVFPSFALLSLSSLSDEAKQ